MKSDLPRVGVIVAEPETEIRTRLVTLCHQIWPTHEVLPRATDFEMSNASEHLATDLMIVRASVLKSSEAFSKALLKWVANGGKLVCIQDSGLVYKGKGWQRVGNLYYLSGETRNHELMKLLLSFRIEQIAQGQMSFPL